LLIPRKLIWVHKHAKYDILVDALNSMPLNKDRPKKYLGLGSLIVHKTLQTCWSQWTYCLHFISCTQMGKRKLVGGHGTPCCDARKINPTICARRRKARQASIARRKICVCHTLWQPGIEKGRLYNRYSDAQDLLWERQMPTLANLRTSAARNISVYYRCVCTKMPPVSE